MTLYYYCKIPCNLKAPLDNSVFLSTSYQSFFRYVLLLLFLLLDFSCNWVYNCWYLQGVRVGPSKLEGSWKYMFLRNSTWFLCSLQTIKGAFRNRIRADFPFQICVDFAFWRLMVRWISTLLFCLMHFTLSIFIKIVDLQIRWRNVFFENPTWFEFLNPRQDGITLLPNVI